MTITTINNRNTYATDGVGTTYPITFKFVNAADLMVRFVSALGAISTPALNIDYVVNMFIDSTGELVFTPALANAGFLHIIRRRTFVQGTSSLGKEEFSAAEVEIIADNLMYFIQDLADLQARSMIIADTDIDGTGAFDARSNRVKNADDPVGLQDLVTKSWMLANAIPGIQGPPGPGATGESNYVLRNGAGTAQAQTADSGWALTQIKQYSTYDWLPTLNNTGADPQLNVDGTGLLTIKGPTGQALAADELDLGVWVKLLAWGATPATSYRVIKGF